MEVYYLNADSSGRIDFNDGAYSIADMGLFKHELAYDTQDDRIVRFKDNIQTHNMQINVSDTDEADWQELYDDLLAVLMTDIQKAEPGYLYVNGCYLRCYIYAMQPQEIFDDWGWQTADIKIVTDRPRWIQEQTVSILPQDETTVYDTDKGYTYGYVYGYPTSRTATYVNIDHYASSDFTMIVYGPATEVAVTIAGHLYAVHYPVASGEYMVIDSRDSQAADRRVYLVKSNGDVANLFNYRDPVDSVLQKIPAGDIEINYSRLYGIDLTIYKERSEPRWT